MRRGRSPHSSNPLSRFQIRHFRGGRHWCTHRLCISLNRSNLNLAGSFVSKCNFNSVNGINSWIARRCAMQRLDARIGNEAHIHKMILYSGRQVQRHQDSTFTYRQTTKDTQLTHSSIRPGPPGKGLFTPRELTNCDQFSRTLVYDRFSLDCNATSAAQSIQH